MKEGKPPAPNEPPLIIVVRQNGALIVKSADRRGADFGLVPGMGLANARARIPALRVEQEDEHADMRLLNDLASMAEMFTPLVALDAKDGLLLDITGCAHLFGGEKQLREKIMARFGRLGLSVRATIAGTPHAAHALARFGSADVVPSGVDDPARALPITALEMTTEIIVGLSRAGLKTLGDLAERPTQTLTARFGMELVAHLERILGREDIRITPLRAPPDCMAERHFPEPLSLMESLFAVFESLARNIAGLLEQRGAGGRAFEASFFRVDGAVRRVTIETVKPTRDPKSLTRLLRLKLEALADPLDPGFGFDSVRFSVLRSETLTLNQPAMDGVGPEVVEKTDGVSDLVERLVARFGRENVRRFVLHDTHDPVRVAGSVPYLLEMVSAPREEAQPDHHSARPLTLFSPPHSIAVSAEVPDGPPFQFRWRRALHEVVCAEGPERIAPEWWRVGQDVQARDYYRIEDRAGHRFWLYREGFYEDGREHPRWYLHGIFA